MNKGVGGAENGRPLEDAATVESANLGSKLAWRNEAEVLTDRFLVLRIFLFGESPRLRPGNDANELEK